MKSRAGFASLLSILVLVVLTMGVVTSVYLVQNKQVFQNKAASAPTIPLAQIQVASGLSALIYGLPNKPDVYSESNLIAINPVSGVYEIKANSFPCAPGTTECEPDRYDIQIPSIVNHIYGLGKQMTVSQVEVEDFLDASFSYGHCWAKRKDGKVMEAYAMGGCRLRTPILVLPEKNLLIAYLQPEVKTLRLTRDGTNNCPVGKTCIVMKKQATYPEGQPAPLVIIKGNNLDEVYSRWYSYLKNYKGLFFKQPLFQNFGVNWEVYGEFGCTATKQNVLDAVDRYQQNRVTISTLTIGSGYWQPPGIDPHINPGIGCGDTVESGYPATDSLQVSDLRYGGLTGLNELFDNLHSQGIMPTIGMRNRIQPGSQTYENITRVENLFKNKGFTGNYLISADTKNIDTRLANYTDASLFHYYLNVFDPKIINSWIDLTKERYGRFEGIKSDDLYVSDQQGLYSFLKKPSTMSAPKGNFRDDISAITLPFWNNKFQGKGIITGDEDWFSQGTDAERIDVMVGLGGGIGAPINYNGYNTKFIMDNGLNAVLSGYVFPMASPQYGYESIGKGYDTTDPALSKMIVRTIQQATFYPVANFSAGFWHLKKPNGTDDTVRQQVAIYFLQLRNRLNQYAFDQAKRWYETGVPTLLRPLIFDFVNDPEVYKQYSYLNSANDSQDPRNEYMFGNALLVRPVFSDTDSVKVYFPEGKWKALISQPPTIGKVYTKGYNNYPLPNIDGNTSKGQTDYPVFLKEGEILAIDDVAGGNLMAYVFLGQQSGSSIYYHYPVSGGMVRLQASVVNGKTLLTNLDSGKRVEMRDDNFGKGFKIVEIKSVL